MDTDRIKLMRLWQINLDYFTLFYTVIIVVKHVWDKVTTVTEYVARLHNHFLISFSVNKTLVNWYTNYKPLKQNDALIISNCVTKTTESYFLLQLLYIFCSAN